MDAVAFRPIRVADLEQMRALHEDWFPVRYSTSFYENAVREKMVGTHDPLFAVIAEIEEDVAADDADDEDDVDAGDDDDDADLGGYEGLDDDEPAPPGWSETATTHNRRRSPPRGALEYLAEPYGGALNQSKQRHERRRRDVSGRRRLHPRRRQKRIIGLVTAQLTNVRGCGDEAALFQPAARFRAEHARRVMYVLTLGSDARFRRRGLARALVEACVRRADAEPGCGAVYLHVISHNAGAIAFYRALHFECLGEIQNYYRIDGKSYNCFVYALYLPKALVVVGSPPQRTTTTGTPTTQTDDEDDDAALRRRPSNAPAVAAPPTPTGSAVGRGGVARGRGLLAATLAVVFPPSLRSCFRDAHRQKG